MRTTIVEDRVLARIAFEAVGWNPSAGPAELADMAFGQAVVALRVMGIATTPEIARTVRADIALVIADPAKIARARSLVARGRPVDPPSSVPLRAAVA